MTKKGYQKRLPKVLPEAGPRPATPAPRVPAPRVSTEATGAAEPVARIVEPIEDVDAVEPVKTDEQQPRPSAERRRPSRGWIVAMVLAGLALNVIVGFLLVTKLLDRGPDRPASVSDTRIPARSDTSYVVSRVLASGDVVVRQRILADQSIQQLRLELPLTPGGEDMAARQVKVVADGVAVVGLATITDGFATYIFAPATDVLIRYRLTGAVQLSESAPGRALAVATSLDVRYAPRVERETRVVRASEVLLLACSPSTEEAPVPCGESDGDGRWRVDLTGRRVSDRVVAQLNLG